MRGQLPRNCERSNSSVDSCFCMLARTTGYSADDCVVIWCAYLSPVAIRNPLSSHPKGMIGYRDLCYSHGSPELPIVEIVSLGAVISVSSRYRISSSPY